MAEDTGEDLGKPEGRECKNHRNMRVWVFTGELGSALYGDQYKEGW